MKQSSIETEINRREVHVSEEVLLLAEVFTARGSRRRLKPNISLASRSFSDSK